MNRVNTSNLPIAVIFGIRFLCFVLSINLLNSTRSPGIRVNTDRRLNIIALIRTMDKSIPILKCMNARAPRPEIVVREDAEISGIALLRAAIQASLVSSV